MSEPNVILFRSRGKAHNKTGQATVNLGEVLNAVVTQPNVLHFHWKEYAVGYDFTTGGEGYSVCRPLNKPKGRSVPASAQTR